MGTTGFGARATVGLDLGSPFTPVREGAIVELVAGMDLSVDLGAERVVFRPSSDGWTDAECPEFVHASLDELVPAAHDRGLEPCLEDVVTSHCGE